MELRWKHDPTRLFAALSLATIIDGGANDGGFASYARSVCPGATIYSFEPVPWLYNALVDKFKADRTFFAYDLALGDANKETAFEINTEQHSSSLLPIRADAGAIFLGLSRLETIHVRLTTLDSWAVGRDLGSPLLLKLDLEGNELAALKGAVGLLSQVDYVLTEINFVLLRDGQPKFRDVDCFLGLCGFEILDIYPGHQDRRTGQAIWADVLFGRTRPITEPRELSASLMNNPERNS
jgi:FkbM family methyltransferase